MKPDGISGPKAQEEIKNLYSTQREEKKLKEACQEYESMFISQLLSTMRKSVPKSDIFGDRKNEEMFQDMMDGEVAKTWSKTEGIGLANILYQQMKKTL